MNRNSQSKFANVPTLNLNELGQEGKRSRFNIPFKHITTFNVGDLVPLNVTEVVPGDIFEQTENFAIRMATPIAPVMDDLVFDTYSFWVPYRQVWEHFKEFMGENNTDKWVQKTEYEIPQILTPEGGYLPGTIGHYMGLTQSNKNSVDALRFRAYCLIWNNYFRDQNNQDPCSIYMGEATQQGTNGTTYQTDAQLGGYCLKAAKTHDYFTSALPSSQKSLNPVLIPLGESAPVIGNGEETQAYFGTQTTPRDISTVTANAGGSTNNRVALGVSWNLENADGGFKFAEQTGLVTDLSTARGANVIEFRNALAIQRMLEKDAIGGTRYFESVRTHYGVTVPDATVQIPEYLGGKRTMINMDQVLQTSATNEITPQGNTAGYSLTVSNNNITYRKGFDEHGVVITVGVARVLNRSYQQGINRLWLKRTRYDMYWPELAAIGMQEIRNEEIYAQGNDEDKQGFGFQERYAEYKYKPNMITGYMNSTVNQNLDYMHYGDYFETLPILGEDFIKEPVEPVDRTIAVTSDLTHQFYGEFRIDIDATRTMPLFSDPSIVSYL